MKLEIGKDYKTLSQENQILKIEKEKLLKKYENKLIDLKSFIRELLNSVDRLLKSSTMRNTEDNYAFNRVEKDRKLLEEALVKFLCATLKY